MAIENRIETGKSSFKSIPRARRLAVVIRQKRSIFLGLTLAAIALVVVITLFRMLGGGGASADVIDFSKSVERIEELSTLKSHIRFGVVVREEGGEMIVRRLTDQIETIGMDGLGDALFQAPTMIVELHGVATYGVPLGDLGSRTRQDDSAVHIRLPKARVLDVKLVARDTKIVAQMKGLLRGGNMTLLLEADRHGESFVREYAEQDTAMISLASERARDLLALLVEQSGKRAIFE